MGGRLAPCTRSNQSGMAGFWSVPSDRGTGLNPGQDLPATDKPRLALFRSAADSDRDSPRGIVQKKGPLEKDFPRPPWARRQPSIEASRVKHRGSRTGANRVLSMGHARIRRTARTARAQRDWVRREEGLLGMIAAKPVGRFGCFLFGFRLVTAPSLSRSQMLPGAASRSGLKDVKANSRLRLSVVWHSCSGLRNHVGLSS
jgi:hypothetical protein